MKKILECKNIKKKYGKKEVLKDVYLSLEKGDILGFIGPNGSGKTTLIKIILGLQSTNGGEVYINGYNIKNDFTLAIKKVGAIVENPDSYMYLSGYENLKLLKNAYDNLDDENIEDILSIVGLQNRMHDKVSKYSLGMRQRLGIAKALIHKPNLLILDEPTNGLDPEGIKDLRNLLIKLSKDGMAILISSHNLYELESFCNKVAIINNGIITDYDDVKNIKNDHDRYLFKVDKKINLNDENIKEIGDDYFIYSANKEMVPKMIKKLIKEKINIYEIKKSEISLEEAFLERTGGKKND